MKKTILGLSLLADLASTQEMAQDGTWYITGSIGQSDYKVNSGDVPPGISVDKKDTSFGVAVGYNFNKNIAVEAGYFDMGKFKFTGTFAGVGVNGDGRAQGFQASAVLSAPIADAFSVYGRLGGAYTDRKANACAGSSCASDSEKKAELLYGVGLGYAFTKNLTGTVEYQKLDNTDVSSINAGIRFSF